MKRIFPSLLALLVVAPGGFLWGQSPTPFGTPSVLPMQDHATSWQSSYAATGQNMAPVLSAPAMPGQMPPAYAPRHTTYLPGPPPHAAGQVPIIHMPPPPGYATAPTWSPPPVASSFATPAGPRYVSLGPSLEEQMMGEEVTGMCAPECRGGWRDSSYWEACCSPCGVPCGQPCCEPCAETCCDPCCEPVCGPCWYATVGGLYLTRNRPRFSQISFDTTDLVGQVLSTNNGLGQWDPGAIARLGWYLSPTCALEATYWGVYPGDATSTVYGANLVGALNSVFDFSPLNIGSDNVNDDLFDGAQAHRIQRDYDVHNVELNFIAGRLPMTPQCGFQVSYLAGLRYFRFTEDFLYASAHDNPIFGADPASEVYYDIRVRNNLWGFQLGGRADWFVTPRFSIYTAPKFGIYGNCMDHHSRIYNVNGTAVVGPGNPLAGGLFDIASDKSIASFLGEIDLGLQYQFSPCLSAEIGYRVLAVSGLAYATDQIPPHFADLPGVAMIDSNADLILHGGYAAVTWAW